MLWLDWRLALVCLAAFPVILYVSRFYRRRAREVYRESRLILGRLNAGLQENIAGVATIQAFGQEAKMYGRFREINYRYRDVLLRSIRYNAVFFPVIELFSALSIGLLLWYGGNLIMANAIQAGVMVAFIQYIQRMYQPIRDLAEKYNIMQAAMASSERIFALLDTPETIKNPAASDGGSNSFAGEIEFKDVWLSYRPGEPVLRGISFRVRPGEKVALVGATGGGKTSIISALCRFYDVERGAILVDGIDVREWNKQELRRHLGLGLAGCVSFFRRHRQQYHARRSAHRRKATIGSGATRPHRAVYRKAAESLSRRSAGARLDPVARPAPVAFLCARAGVRSEDFDSRRSDQLGRHPDRNADSTALSTSC